MKKMKKIKLSENDLIRVIKRVINEQDNSLYSEIKHIIRNSNDSKESVVDTLRMIADEIEDGMSMRRDTINRWDKENKRAHRLGGLDPDNEF